MSQRLASIENIKSLVKPRLNTSGRHKRIIPVHYRMIGLGLNAVSYISNEWAAEVLSKIWFTVFKSKPKPWINMFWQQAQTRVDLQLKAHLIPVSLWGQGPLVVMMHGWSGSGFQFRRLIPGLVAAGYQVAVFDAPAHGGNPGKQTNLLEFIECLFVIQQQIGAIDTVMAHSLGGMAAVAAVQRGLRVQQMVLFGPHLDVQGMYQSYRDVFKLNVKLSNLFHDSIGQKMADIFGVDDIWSVFTPENMLAQIECRGLLIYDSEDNEIPQDQFMSVARHWRGCKILETEGLGHNDILKDETVIQKVLGFMSDS